MNNGIRKLITRLVLYLGFFGFFVFGPVLILHMMFPKENADVWMTFLGSYLGSIIAVIGTVIITRMQIKTERLDSLNNSLFIERYQILNSLLSDLYHTKDEVLGYSRNVKVIKRYLKSNGKIRGIKGYTQNFINQFDANQLVSFYSYSKNRLMSMDLSSKDQDAVNEIVNRLFNNNRKLIVAFHKFSRAYTNLNGDNDDNEGEIDQIINSLSIEGQNLRLIIKQLDNLDEEIQNVIRNNRDQIISR